MPIPSFETTSDTSSIFSIRPNASILSDSISSSNDSYPSSFNQLSPNLSYSSSMTSATDADLGTIQGKQWNDLNGNGNRDTNEPGLAGWTIYLDQNRNAQRDGGEQFTLTDVNGNYTFTNLQPGTYIVAAVVESGWAGTSRTKPCQLILFR